MRSQCRITKEMKALGIKIIRVKTHNHTQIGIHLLCPNQRELEDAIETAERDMFKTIYIHTMSSWAPGAMKRSV